MYTRFYRLGGRPFQLIPDRRFFFASRAHRRALARLALGLAQAEGFIVVSGETGSGKTLLMDVLGAQLRGSRMSMVRLDRAPDDADEVLASMARVLGLDGPLPAAQREAIERRLRALARGGRRVLLVVDDAHGCSPAALEVLRRLSDLRSDGRALMQILLLGQPRLERLLAAPSLEHLRERVVMTHRLGRLEPDEVASYVEHRLVRAGWRGDPVFGAETLRAIGAYAIGLPRRINLLCVRLLIGGAAQQRHVIDVAAVAHAAHESALANGAVGLQPEEGFEPPTAIEPSPEMAGSLQDADAGEPIGSIDEALVSPPDDASDEQITMADEGTNAAAQHKATADRWWIEVARVQRELERTLDELSDERQKGRSLRAEADRLRAQLHRVELDRLRVEAETARRTIEALGADRLDVGSHGSRGLDGEEPR